MVLALGQIASRARRYNGTLGTVKYKSIYIYNLGCAKVLAQLAQLSIHVCQALAQGNWW